MIRTTQKYIEEQELLPNNRHNQDIKIIVGLSGGADSVVLLSILNSLGYNCIAAHCNFHLRGEESLRDERFAEEFASAINIPFIKQSFNTTEYAKEKKISIEMAARNLRYEWFEKIRTNNNADFIAIAHHSNDNIETFFLNLLRGTGIKGLTGIPPKNGAIIRPLLNVSREEIIEYAKERNIPYIIDSTNLEEEYTRNKIRLSLIPVLKTLHPSVETSILRSMENLTEVNKIYNKEIGYAKDTIFDLQKKTINIKRLKETPSPVSVLFEILKDFHFNRDTVKNIAKSIDEQAGKEFHSSDYILIKNRNEFVLIPQKQQTTNISLYNIEEKEQIIRQPLNLQISFQENNESFSIEKNKNIAYFDFEKLHFPLTIRKWEKGDRFIPFGMQGSQKLSDFFNNIKIDKQEKENIWLLCSQSDIIWVIGHRTDNRYRINPNTKKTCIIKLV